MISLVLNLNSFLLNGRCLLVVILGPPMEKTGKARIASISLAGYRFQKYVLFRLLAVYHKPIDNVLVFANPEGLRQRSRLVRRTLTSQSCLLNLLFRYISYRPKAVRPAREYSVICSSRLLK